MKTLDVALIEYFENASFFGDFGSVVNGLAETSNDAPSLIYETIPKDFLGSIGTNSSTVVFAVVGSATDPNLLSLMNNTIQYIEAKDGGSMEGVSTQSIVRTKPMQTIPDTRNKQVMYIIEYDFKWISLT